MKKEATNPDPMLSNASNWTAGIFYSNANDPRPIVRSGKVGWTMNCAKPLGWVLVVLFFATVIGGHFILLNLGFPPFARLGILVAALVPWLLLFSIVSKPREGQIP